MNNSKKIAGLKSSAVARTNETFIKAEKAIDELLKNNEPVSFQSVSKQAGISKTYLYNDSKLRQIIEENRLKSSKLTENENPCTKKQIQIINGLKYRVRILETRNAELTKQIETLYGKFFE